MLATEPTLFETSSGHLSLRYGKEALEDPVDPIAGAASFIKQENLEGIDHVVVFGAGLGYRVRRLAELGCASPIVFEPCEGALALRKAHGPTWPEGAKLFTEPRELHRHLLAVSRPDQRTVLLGSPPYVRAFKQSHDEVASIIQEIQGLVVLRKNSVMDRAEVLSEKVVSNLPFLRTVPPLDRVGKPLAGRPAFIVSAGPSLDKNRHLLAEAGKRGAVFAVNTSAPVFGALSVPIDLLVAIEALDASEPMKKAQGLVRAVALDLSAGEGNWTAIDGAKQVVFCADAPQYRGLTDSLGMERLGYGGSVATAAFSVAVRLGADPIVLVGQDLAYTDRRGYAKDTLFEATRTRREGPLLIIERAAKWDELTVAGGIRLPGNVRPCVEVPAWGGGDRRVESTHELTLFRRWFEGAAEVFGKDRRLINATEGGASIEGFEEIPLAEVLAQLEVRDSGLETAIRAAAPIESARIANTASKIAKASRDLAKAARKAEKTAEGRAGSAHPRAAAEVRACAAHAPLAEAHAAPGLMALRDEEGLSDRARTLRTYGAIRRSAGRIAALAERAAARITGVRSPG